MNKKQLAQKGTNAIVTSAFVATLVMGGAGTAFAAPDAPKPTPDPAPKTAQQNNTFTLSWRGKDLKSVLRGDTLTAKFTVNSNNDKVQKGAQDRTITLHAKNGVFAGIPSGADKTSKITDGGRTMTVVIKDMAYGTAKVMDVPVVADGDAGQKVQVVGDDNKGTDGKTTEVPVTTVSGGDVVFQDSNEYGHFSSEEYKDNANRRIGMPLAITVPVGSSDISPDVEFDLTLTPNNPGSKIASKNILDPKGAFIPSGKWGSITSSEDNGTFAKDAKVTFLGNGKYHVVLKGIPTDPAQQAQKGFSGKKQGLSPDRIYMTSGEFVVDAPIKDLMADNYTIGFSAQVSNLKMTTAQGAPIPEDSSQNNTEKFLYTPSGSIASWWDRHSAVKPVDTKDADWLLVGDWGKNFNAISEPGNGGAWSAAGQILPGQHALMVADMQTPDSTKGIAFPIDRDTARFDGHIQVYVPGIPETDLKVQYSTTAIADINNMNPNDLQWVDKMPDKDAVTAIRVLWNPKQALHGNKDGILRVGVEVLPTATTGQGVWSIGYIRGMDDNWSNPTSGGHLTDVDGGRFGHTNYQRDYIKVVGTRVQSGTQFEDKTVASGDKTKVKVTAGVNTKPGWTGKMKVVTQLQPGIKFISADKKPTSVDIGKDGVTTITWDQVAAESNKPQEYTITVQGTGDSRATSGYFATTTVTNLNPNKSDSATGKEAVSRDDLAISFDGTTQLVKTAQQAHVVAQSGEKSTWHLTVQNRDSVAQEKTDVIDVLPFNGDHLGSKYTGTYTVGDVAVKGGAKGATVYYTSADPKTLSTDPAAEVNGGFAAPSAIWSTKKPAKVTGVRVVTGELGIGKTYSLDIDWTAQNNVIGDVYVNTAGSRATDTKLLMLNAAMSDVISDGSVLKVDKTWVPEDITPGATIHYTATVLNDSDHTAYNVHFTDTPGDGIEEGSLVLSDPQKGMVNGNKWAIGNLAPHEKVTVKVTAKVDKNWHANPIVNQVNVSNPSNPPKTTCTPNVGVEKDNDQCDVVSITENSKLQIHKEVTGDQSKMLPGGEVEYTVSVTNAGTDPARGVVVTDKPGKMFVPGSVKYVDGSASQGTADKDQWKVGIVKPGQVVTIKVRGKLVDTWKGDKIVNSASVENPWHPYNGKTCKPNDALNKDDDQCDISEFTENSKLQVDKKLDTAAAKILPGGKVEYTITVKNSGKALASNVKVTDKPGKMFKKGSLAYVKGTASQGTTDGVAWNVGQLKPGQTATVKVIGTLIGEWKGEHIVNGTTVENPWHPYLGKTCTPNDVVGNDDDQCDVVDLYENSKLQIDKKLSTPAEKILPGGKVRYTITVKNSGKDTATNVLVKDKPGTLIDKGTLVYVPKSASQGEAGKDGWQVGTLKPGQEATIQVEGTLSKNWKGEKIDNLATVENPWHPYNGKTCNPNDVVGKDDDQCDAVSTTENSVLRIDKTLKTPDAGLVPGGKVRYTITVKNAGKDPAVNVKVTDAPGKMFVKDSMTYVPKTASQGTTGKGLDWAVGTLKPGQTATVEVEGTLINEWKGEQVDNSATVYNPWHPVSPDANQPNVGVDNDKDQFDVVSKKENSLLQIDKKLDTPMEKVLPGGDVEYTITVKNAGKDDAANVKVTDKPGNMFVKDSVKYVDGSASAGKTDGTVWNVGELKAGATATIKVRGKLIGEWKGEKIVNTSTVENPWHPYLGKSCNPNDVVGNDDDQCDVVELQENTMLKVDKVADSNKPVHPGDTITYTLTAKNSGKDIAHNVVVTDKPGKGLVDGSVAFVKGSASQGSFDGLTWKVGTLKPGETATIKVTGKVSEDAVKTGAVNDTVIANPWHPEIPGASQVNVGVDNDTDQFDRVLVKVDLPPAPPVKQAPPAPPVKDAPPAPPTSHVKTGGDAASVMESPAGVGGALAGMGILAGLAAFFERRRRRSEG